MSVFSNSQLATAAFNIILILQKTSCSDFQLCKYKAFKQACQNVIKLTFFYNKVYLKNKNLVRTSNTTFRDEMYLEG